MSGERVRDELSRAPRHARRAPSPSATSPCGARWPSSSPRSTACAASSRTRTTTSTSSSTRSRRSPTSSAWSRSSAVAGSSRSPAEAGLPGVEPLVPVSWAVLLHDIGKPVVRVVDEQGRVIFWHHDETGRQMAADIGARFNFSNRFVEYVGTLVRQHLRLGFLVARAAADAPGPGPVPARRQPLGVRVRRRLALRPAGDARREDVAHLDGAALPAGALGVDGGEQGAGAAAAQRRRRDGAARHRARAGGRARRWTRSRRRSRPARSPTPTARGRSCWSGGGGMSATARPARGRHRGADRAGPAMPELPEVETVRRRLLTCLPGLLLREVVVNDWTVSVQTEQELTRALAGRRVTGLRRRGKYLLVDLGPRRSRRPPAAPAGRRAVRRPVRGRHPPAHDRPAGLPPGARRAAGALRLARSSRRRRCTSRTCAGSAASGPSTRRPRTSSSPRAAWAPSRSGRSSRVAYLRGALRGQTRAAQGVPARPAAHRRRRQHLRRRGAVPRPAAPAARGRERGAA